MLPSGVWKSFSWKAPAEATPRASGRTRPAIAIGSSLFTSGRLTARGAQVHRGSVITGPGQQPALTARPGPQPHVGPAAGRLHRQPGERFLGAGPLPRLDHRGLEGLPFGRGQVLHDDRV